MLKKFKIPRSLFIHCDIVDKQNVKGKPFEKIYYEMPQNLFCKATKSRYLNSITLSVTDQNDTLIDFGEFPLEFVLEITLYRKLPLISPGIKQLRKRFWVGL